MMLGSKGFLTPLIPDCYVLCTPAIFKNIRNPLIFLRKMATYSCFWRVKRSKILLQASLHRLSDLLPLVSSYAINKKDWVNIMKEKLMRFMYGRYGVDTFGKFLLWSGVILMLITSIFHFRIFYVIGWAFVIYSYYRMFSRQTYKRALENQKFLQHTSKIRGFFAKQKYMAAQRKTHHIYKCPNCKQKIRVPKGKGKIEIRCPKCQTTFIKKS